MIKTEPFSTTGSDDKGLTPCITQSVPSRRSGKQLSRSRHLVRDHIVSEEKMRNPDKGRVEIFVF